MAAILVKIGALALKTIAKPLSTRFQAYVMSHPVARQRAISAAQVLHRFEVLITRGAEGKTGRAFIADMTEEKSIELASKLASESFVFGVGIVIVLFEYNRQVRKEAAKKRAEHAERQAILENARYERERLAEENRLQQETIRRLFTRVDSLEERMRALQEEAFAKEAEKQRRGWTLGGFFGPKAVASAA